MKEVLTSLPRYDYKRDDVGYSFITDDGVTYYIYFISMGNNFSANVCSFNIERDRHATYNEKTRNTIMQILNDYFTCENAILYVCETEDDRQESRARLFNYWMKQYGKGYSKIDYNSGNFYASVIFQNANLLRDLIKEDFANFVQLMAMMM